MTDVQAGVDATPDADLRRIIKAACKESKTVERILAEHLLFSESVFDDDVSSCSDGNTPKIKGRKRKAESGLAGRTAKGGAKIPPVDDKRVKLRFVECSQCEGQFDILKNDDTACRWHTSELEEDQDPDVYFDHYEPKMMQGDCWNWTCCGKVGDLDDTPGGGCSIGPHVQIGVGFRKKTKFPYAQETQRKEVVVIDDDSESTTTTPEP